MAAHSELNPESLLAGAGVLSRPAEEFENDPSVELLWAKKAYEHAEVYFNILCSVDPTLLKLTPNDNEIYEAFRADFPDFSIEVINEDEMKSAAGFIFGFTTSARRFKFQLLSTEIIFRHVYEKLQKWREYCEKFKNKVEDYSFGTLLRKDCTKEYTEENSILVTRIQFLAIELARNREGFNNCIRSKYRQNKNDKS